jgi:uncharacterized membrane protein
MTQIWLMVLLALPAVLLRFTHFREVPVPAEATAHSEVKDAGAQSSLAISIPLALALTAVFLSDQAAGWLKVAGVPIPSILILTTLALVLAQVPGVNRLTMAQPLGVWGMLLFLACIGASADLAALVASREVGLLLFAFVAIVLVVHLAILLAYGWWRRVDPAVLTMASVTNIGGSTTAFVMAEAHRREDLLLPGILVGALGNAIGTYAGFSIAELLGA